MKHGFIACAAAAVTTVPCDTAGNAERIIKKYSILAERGVKLAAFSALCVTGYTCGDYFKQKLLIDQAEKAVVEICAATENRECVAVIGCPVITGFKLYNCAVVCYKGEILGIVPKSNLSEYGEFDESRLFSEAPETNCEITFAGKKTLFGVRQIFTCEDMPLFSFAVEISEDLLAPLPISSEHAANGAAVIVNIAADGEAAAKSGYRYDLIKTHSKRISAGYIYACAGDGESTSVCAFSGHSMIFEAGTPLAESKPFEFVDCIAEIDCEKPAFCKRAYNLYKKGKTRDGYEFRRFAMTVAETKLTRKINPYPFIPEKNAGERWREILAIQSHALKKRLDVCGAKPVLNISGGLDSALAFVVCLEAVRLSGRNASDIVCINSPCFGTTARTKNNAEVICRGMGADFRVIDITAAVERHLADIKHTGEKRGAAFENAQARERTQVAMDIANMENGIMIGTGDMSELALGWTTFNGDHISMYSVNAGVPKSIIKYILCYYADNNASGSVKDAFYDICATPVSPELLCPENGEICQKTEDIIGPYVIHDFILYYLVKYGFTPEKIFRLAQNAFSGIYTEVVLRRTFGIFYSRFTVQQFKRSCAPDSPKIGSVSLSPQSGWKAPADASVKLWEKQIKNIVSG